jgi:hypothetical protein
MRPDQGKEIKRGQETGFRVQDTTLVYSTRVLNPDL